MKKLFKSKKGFNDTAIQILIVTIFLFTGAFITFFNEEFGTSHGAPNANVLTNEEGVDTGSIGALTAVGSSIEIAINTVKLAFFPFAVALGLPVFLAVIFQILSIGLIFTFANFLRGK